MNADAAVKLLTLIMSAVIAPACKKPTLSAITQSIISFPVASSFLLLFSDESLKPVASSASPVLIQA